MVKIFKVRPLRGFMNYYTKRRAILGTSIGLLVLLYLLKNASLSIRIFGFLFGLWVFYFFDRAFDVKYRVVHYALAVIILAFGVLLSPIYFVSENFDKVLHLVMPFVASILLFFAVDKQKFTFRWKLLITFMFLISFLAIHEIGEFAFDYFWPLLKMQGVYLRDITGLEKYTLVLDKNTDTMLDMMFGVLGSFAFVVWKTVVSFYDKNLKG